MAGYIGATSVSFSVTEADIKGDIKSTDASPEVTLQNTTEEDTDGGRESKITFKGEQSGGEITTLAQIQASHDGTADDEKGDLIFSTNDGADGNTPTERMRIDSAGNVGIGTNSPTLTAGATGVDIYDNNDAQIRLHNSTTGTTASDGLLISLASDNSGYFYNYESAPLIFGTNSAEAMRIDGSGNLLVGKTSSNATTQGFEARSNGLGIFNVSNGYTLQLRRYGSDGEIIDFRKDGTTVGSIDSRSGSSNIAINSASNSGRLSCGGSEKYGWNLTNFWSVSDNTNDLGINTNRWDDIYATNGTIQTSDRNEKQDIAELDEAEKRVATAAKGLIRKYRWIDAVQEKGDDARIHVGIIAQDLQAAFEAEGLDASRYAMFISSTWWEADETYTDDDGVEHTRTNTYETQEEAPEGATERTRLGVRYPELLAFIIGAL